MTGAELVFWLLLVLICICFVLACVFALVSLVSKSSLYLSPSQRRLPVFPSLARSQIVLVETQNLPMFVPRA